MGSVGLRSSSVVGNVMRIVKDRGSGLLKSGQGFCLWSKMRLVLVLSQIEWAGASGLLSYRRRDWRIGPRSSTIFIFRDPSEAKTSSTPLLRPPDPPPATPFDLGPDPSPNRRDASGTRPCHSNSIARHARLVADSFSTSLEPVRSRHFTRLSNTFFLSCSLEN